MVDKALVTRRALDFEDYTDMLRRNVRWIIGPVFAGLVVSTVVAFLLQDTYISRAVIRIVPQQISGELVQNASAQDMSDRIRGLTGLIISRTTLTELIKANDLYKPELKSEPMEDVVTTMREAIGVAPAGIPNGQGNGFTTMVVSFKYRDRTLAYKICSELVTRFLNMSTQESTDSQSSAKGFLNGERTTTKEAMDKAEQRLSDYRMKHAGALPEEMPGNLQQMTAIGQRLNSLSDAATRTSERRMMLESTLRISKDRLNAIRSIGPLSVAQNEKSSDLDKQISDLEGNIASMKDRYTADYPDLQSAQERLVVLKHQRDEVGKPSTTKSAVGENPMAARERIDAQGQIDSIESQIKATAMEEQQISREILTANGQLRAFQARLDSSPAGEREYSDLLQERDTAKQKYLDADAKAHKSDVSYNMEQNKQGETLDEIDPPNLPTEPTEPKRALIIPIGAVGGLLVGILLVAIREMKDTSLKNLKDARMYTQLSILGSIPLLENDVVVQRRKQVMLVSWATATVLGIAIIVGSVAHYYLSRA
jgi:uncharacterized protein involved in exopolysaccharide biosynthesis